LFRSGDLGPEQPLDRDGRLEAPAVEGSQDVVEGFERARHFQIGELSADLFPEGRCDGFHTSASGLPRCVSWV
jgi:hypothetical protein